MEALKMKHLNLRNLLLALIIVFFMQNGSISPPDLPEDYNSEANMIAPCNDSPHSSSPMTKQAYLNNIFP